MANPLEDILFRQFAYLARYDMAAPENFMASLLEISDDLAKRLEEMLLDPKKLKKAERVKILLSQVEIELQATYERLAVDVQAEAEQGAKIAYQTTGKAYKDATGIDGLTFDQVPIDAINVWSDISNRVSVGVGDDTRFFRASDEIQKLFGQHAKQYKGVIGASLARGLGIEEAVAIMRSRSAIMDSVKGHQARAITRTSIADSMRRAQEWTEDNNFADVIDGYQWISTMDNRTTIQCAGRAGEIKEKRADFDGLPPLHWNCRSLVIGVTDFTDRKKQTQRTRTWDEKLVVDHGEVRTKFTLASDDVKTIKTNAGDPKFSAFDSWFRTIPQDRQIQWLGPQKFKLYQTGKLGTKDLIDGEGRVRTVAELAKIVGMNAEDLKDIRKRDIPAYKPEVSRAAAKMMDKQPKP